MPVSRRLCACITVVCAAVSINTSARSATLEIVSQEGPMNGWNFPSGVCRGGSQSVVSMSADGRYVAFITDSKNWDDGQIWGNNTVAVLKDMTTGDMTLVSTALGGGSLNEGIDSVCVSSDGHYVVFTSWASNIVPNDTNNSGDVFLYNTWLGTTTRVNVSDAGAQGNQESWATSHCITADGRYVVFQSEASNLVPNDTNDDRDVFIRDLQLGKTTLLSKSSTGVQGNGSSEEPVITPDGRYVTYFSTSTNLVSGTVGGMPRVYIRDNDPTKNTTSLVAVGALPSCSADGRYITYTTLPGTVSAWTQAYVHDMTLGTDKPASVAPDGVTLGNKDSGFSWMSDNGRYVVFSSKARNLVAGDTNDEADVFVRDLQTSTTTRISLGMDGLQGKRSSGFGYPSAAGTKFAFISNSEDLVSLDVNETTDVFLYSTGAVQGFKTSDVAASAAIAGGKAAASSADLALYNVVKTGSGASKVDMADAVRIARMAAGLDPQ